MYSLMVAAMGRKVVSVDAMADNLAFIHQSRLNNGFPEAGLTLVHNAVR